MFDRLRSEYKATLKSADTEEHIDLFFYRPIGFMWALLFKSLHCTPNVVTIISIFFGVACGFFIYPADYGLNLLAILMLVIANSLDSADGQLARMTKQYSRLGRILDGMAGDLWFISIYIAICLRTNRDLAFFHEHPWVIWLIAVLAGVCHARQAAVADYLRQFHLMFVKKDFPTEFETSANIKAQIRNTRNIFSKIVLYFYYLYTCLQERSFPQMGLLMQQLRRDYPDGKLPGPLAEQLRVATLPMCKWENFMTFNWRSFALFASILVGRPMWYFIAELTVFNIVLAYVQVRHEQICKSVLKSC